jgi:site-specific DNA-methyltransferase (adenine-specific)
MAVLLKPFATVPGRRAANRFFLSDCVDVFRHLAAQSVDVIVTSPPYNLGIRYNRYQDTLSQADYLEWTNTWVAAALRVLRPEGSLFLNVGAKPSDPWTALDVAPTVRSHLRLRTSFTGSNRSPSSADLAGASARMDRDLAVGHYKPINSDRFVNDCHEFIFHFTPGGRTPLDRRAVGVPYQDPSNIKRWAQAGGGRRCRGNTWFIPYETIQRRDRDRPHPATFPSRLAEQCLLLHGLSRIETVMDPFVGLGSTAVACARHDIGFIGADIDETYLAEAAERTWSAVLDRAAADKRPAKARRGDLRAGKTPCSRMMPCNGLSGRTGSSRSPGRAKRMSWSAAVSERPDLRGPDHVVVARFASTRFRALVKSFVFRPQCRRFLPRACAGCPTLRTNSDLLRIDVLVDPAADPRARGSIV